MDPYTNICTSIVYVPMYYVYHYSLYILYCIVYSCGKLLRSELEVQTHAARTQHKNFSESTEEIKPLSEEEKKAQTEK